MRMESTRGQAHGGVMLKHTSHVVHHYAVEQGTLGRNPLFYSAESCSMRVTRGRFLAPKTPRRLRPDSAAYRER
jgi:hypothetical protein